VEEAGTPDPMVHIRIREAAVLGREHQVVVEGLRMVVVPLLGPSVVVEVHCELVSSHVPRLPPHEARYR